MLRTVLIVSGALAVAGAAEAQTPAPAAPAAPAAAPASSGSALVGRTEADVRVLLGQPHVARREANGAMWTYRRPSCSLFVFFQNRDGQGLRVSGANAGPRRWGEPSPDLDACMAERPTP